MFLIVLPMMSIHRRVQAGHLVRQASLLSKLIHKTGRKTAFCIDTYKIRRTTTNIYSICMSHIENIDIIHFAHERGRERER